MKASIALSDQQTSRESPSKQEPELTLIYTNKAAEISVAPMDSDSQRNHMVISQVASPLLRPHASNSPQPYLAKTWKISKDGLTWDFELRSHLTCEDGEKIDAEGYIESFNKSAKIYAANGTTILLDNIVGWEDFKSGKSSQIAGLTRSKDGSITFNFKKFDSGTVHYLAMPYFAYYCRSNFDKDGNWQDKRKIVSSSAYRITDISNFTVSFTLRNDWFTTHPKSVKTVKYELMDPNDIGALKPSKTIIFANNKRKIPKSPAGYRSISGMPTYLASVVLSPQMDNIFKNSENRCIFKTKIKEIKRRLEDKENDLLLTDSVFLANPNKTHHKTCTGPLVGQNERELQFLYPTGGDNPVRSYVRTVITTALKELKVPFKIVDGYKNKDQRYKIHSNMHYDIRVAYVIAGVSMYNWPVKMMWCSKMGVSFPDASGDICRLVENNDKKKLLTVDRYYENSFNETIDRDATVLPLFFTRPYFLFSNDLRSSLDPLITDGIYFDALSLAVDDAKL